MLADAYGIGPGSAPRDLPSTCAGGQDDVSSQANSLKSHPFLIGRNIFEEHAIENGTSLGLPQVIRYVVFRYEANITSNEANVFFQAQIGYEGVSLRIPKRFAPGSKKQIQLRVVG